MKRDWRNSWEKKPGHRPPCERLPQRFLLGSTFSCGSLLADLRFLVSRGTTPIVRTGSGVAFPGGRLAQHGSPAQEHASSLFMCAHRDQGKETTRNKTGAFKAHRGIPKTGSIGHRKSYKHNSYMVQSHQLNTETCRVPSARAANSHMLFHTVFRMPNFLLYKHLHAIIEDRMFFLTFQVGENARAETLVSSTNAHRVTPHHRCNR